MTGRFETLVYTDCKPGEGLNGTAGLQFQARSTADAASAEPLMRHVLYEPPHSWMSELRPVEEYPPSYAHICEGDLFVTAAGVYLGKEANGGRQGNQLTHGITTRDPATYGNVRPVQLYRAAFWRTRPVAGTVSEPVPEGWAPGPFDPENAVEFVRSQPAGEQTLTALVSALDAIGEPKAGKVLFIATDPEPVLRWLTAAMLLLPQGKAVRIGFKVFCTDPTKTPLPVLAMHPDWSARIPVDNDRGYIVFDLVTGEHSQVTPRPILKGWVRQFLRDDPWDVVDAVQVAGACGLDDQPEAAAQLARAAVMQQVPDLDVAEPIVQWVREGPQALRLAHASDIALLFIKDPQRWPLGVLLHLDAAGRDGLLDGRAGTVRIALLRAEIARARQGTAWYGTAPQSLPADEWTQAHATVAEDIFVTELNSGVAPHVYDSLLCLAQRYQIRLSYPKIVNSAHRFIVDWADHPDRPWRTESWPCRAEFEDQLVDELMMRINKDRSQAGPIGDRWWERLLNRRHNLEPVLAATVVGSALKHSTDRTAFAQRELMLTRNNPQAYLTTVQQLWSRSEPTYEEMRLLVELTPPEMALPPEVFAPAVSDLRGAQALRPETVRLVRSLVEHGRVSATTEIDLILEHDERVRSACAIEPRNLPKLVKALNPMNRKVLAMHCDRIAGALVASPAESAEEMDTMMDFLRPRAQLLERFITMLAAATMRGEFPAVFTSSVFVCANKMFDDPLRRTVRVGWLSWMSGKPKNVKQVRKSLASYGSQWVDKFDALDEHNKRNKWRLEGAVW